MGWGDFGSNGSVHWRITYNDATGSIDHLDYDDFKKHPKKPDPDTRPPIGDGKAGAGKFVVTARYNNHGEAKAALTQAMAKLGSGGTVVSLEVDVHANYRAKINPANRDEWEISVDW